MSIESDQRAWLDRVLAVTGMTPTELARRAGLNHSTITRFLAGGRDGHVLRQASIRKIEQVSGIASENALPEPPGTASGGGFAENDGQPFDRSAQGILGDMVRAALQQRNNIDPWILRTRAIELLGYRPGDVVIVALGEQPRPGDVVCFQHYDWMGGGSSTKFRVYQPPVLVAATGDADLLRAYSLEDSAVAIKGVVLNSLRARAAA